nr:Fc receptor-like protein 5 [Pelodiscus sinensis]|eukprot:XP_014428740.1 Fc receptor-like protein 5 [Pelodiscus sinensis]
MNTGEGRRKAASTCASHLVVVTMFFGPSALICTQPQLSKVLVTPVNIFSNLVMPMLNPAIYTLRNKEVKAALKKLSGASLQSLPRLVSPAAHLPSPTLSVDPSHTVYLPGELVTLTCSAPRRIRPSGYKFYQEGQQLDSSTREAQLVFRAQKEMAGSYTCVYWRQEFYWSISTSRSSNYISIAVTDPLPAPQLTVSPQQPVYIAGEALTLTCSGTGSPTVSGVRFFRDGQEIHSKELPSPRYSYTDSLQVPGLSGSHSGEYSCKSWKTVSGREIPSGMSETFMIALTDPLPAPQLTVSPQHPIYIIGESVTLTCSAARVPTVSGIRFFRDGQKIHSKELPSSQNSYTHSLPLSGLSGLQAGAYSCELWKMNSGREIISEMSKPISIRVTAPLPAPQLTVSPQHPVYITGETVTLTCSAAGVPTVSGIRFFRNGQKIQLLEFPSPQDSYTDSLLFPGVSGLQDGVYSCESWDTENGREIPSERSRPISIGVTDALPAPQLTVSPQRPVYIAGGAVNLTCSATGAPTVSGIRFFRNGREIQSQDLPSPQDSYTSSYQLSAVSESHDGEYSCQSWKTMSGQEIPSAMSKTVSIAVTARLPTPQLTMSPQQLVYISGESMTLTCSAVGVPTLSGIRFFRDSQKIHSKELPSPRDSYMGSVQLPGLSKSHSGVYSCESWKSVSDREIPSLKSENFSITVTAPFPPPQLTVSPQQPVYITGESVTLTCSAAGAPAPSGFRFFRDGQKIHSQEVTSPGYSSTYSIWLSRESGSQAGAYSCEFWKTESGREIESERSPPISIAVTARGFLWFRELAVGGSFFLINGLIFLVSYCCFRSSN